MVTTTYSIHEVANLFPVMSDEEFASLVEDIKTNGQREPITVYQNRIIDGRNRYAACQELGIEPQTREWDGKGSMVDFVLSLNLKRRHLTPSQKAAVAVGMLPLLEQEAKERQITTLKKGDKIPDTEKIPEREKGESRTKAAKIVGTNERYVSDAKQIQKEAPEVFDMMKNGEITIRTAKQYASLPQDARERLLENLPKQEEGETKACTVCGELLPLEKFSPNTSMCTPCRYIKYAKNKNQPPAESEETDERQEWLDCEVNTLNNHLNQLMMFVERVDDLDEVVSLGVARVENFYLEAVFVLEEVAKAIKNKTGA